MAFWCAAIAQAFFFAARDGGFCARNMPTHGEWQHGWAFWHLRRCIAGAADSLQSKPVIWGITP